MAKRERDTPGGHRGRLDLLGLILVAGGLLWLLALISYDRLDLPTNTSHPHAEPRNWIGLAGAWWAEASFFLLGTPAVLLPLVALLLGLGFLFESFALFRRRWIWLALLVLVSTGFFDLHGAWLGRLAPHDLPGGLIGNLANRYAFHFIGTAGATTVFIVLYLLSLLGLTDFQLFQWLRDAWQRRRDAAEAALSEEQKLDRRARDLEREARRLQEMVDRGRSPAAPGPGKELGPDLQPVPEPTVRDLSVPLTKPPSPRKADKPEAARPSAEELEGEVITATEIAAATTEQILGQPDAARAGAISDDDADGSDTARNVPPSGPKPKAPGRKKLSVAAAPIIGNYQLPPLTLLNYADPNLKPTESKEDLMANARLMQQTLAQFGIEVAMGDITKGPTITRYELHPAPGVKLERITALTNNIAAALKAERIHILAPVPGKSSVGVEVPNSVKSKVIMRDLLESEEWMRSRARVPLALGKDVYGHAMIADLSEMPHLLIAGSTGSGKSVCLNAIVASLLYRFAPDQLRFVMIDPKVVELQQYNMLPHLVVPVVTDPKKVVLALRWVVNEMEKRYQIFARVGARNIRAFNERPRTPLPKSVQPELPLSTTREKIEASQEGFAVELDEDMVSAQDEDIVIPDKLSYIVVVIDELADLMLVAPADFEMAIARITQMARAAGIHCIVATQRPSVDVITGVIKANIPARIAFQVASKVDSRTILDQMGADKLLGKGDMLYLPPGSARLIRAQGALITDQEIQKLVEFIARQGKPSYELEIHQQLQRSVRDLEDEGGDQDEELVEQCIEVIRSEGKASTSLLQRRLRIGYGRAARIMDILEERGVVGPARGAEPREILIDLDAQAADGRSEPVS